MSEVLRAILDKNCTYSQSSFYTSAVGPVAVTNTGTKTYARRQGSIACKIDTYFLVLGASQCSCFQGTTNGWAAKSEATTFEIQRASNGAKYSRFAQVKVNQNYNLNNFTPLDEYILFSPGELIVILEDVRATGGIAPPFNFTTFVTLMGVEYKMPAGKGNLNYGY